jgi:Uma2 family endonuclease
MTMSISTLLTDEEFLNLPEFAGRQELLDGELIELPPAKHSHSELVKRLVELLHTALDTSRVWTETAYRLRRGRWLVPDASVSWPNQQVEDDWFQGSPMLAVEVASRGNSPDQLEQKVVAYLEHGVGEVWIIYPKTRTMVVFRKGSTVRVASDSDYACDLIGVTVTPEHRTPLK